MLACHKVERSAARYVVGALPPWNRAAMARHLDICARCRLLIESHHRVAVLLDGIGANDPPPGLWQRVSNEIGPETPGHARLPAGPWDWRPGIAVATAGVAVGVLLGQSLGWSTGGTPSTIASANQPSPVISTFVQQHSHLDTQEPLADQISLGAYITTAYRENERWEGTMRRGR